MFLDNYPQLLKNVECVLYFYTTYLHNTRRNNKVIVLKINLFFVEFESNLNLIFKSENIEQRLMWV